MSMETPIFDRLLLTGATDGLGRALRGPLKQLARVLRVSDIPPLDLAAPNRKTAAC